LYKYKSLFNFKLIRLVLSDEPSNSSCLNVPSIPKDMLVEELVNCGRFPYQSWWKQQGSHDKEVVDAALEATQVSHLRNQLVSSLSGGERQRVWIAMALAQEPKVLILDEPTTYLDINHQLEIMELLQGLNRREGLTVVMVLHELNQAAQYSHRVGVLYQGHILADGTPKDVMTEELLEKVNAVIKEIQEQKAFEKELDTNKLNEAEISDILMIKEKIKLHTFIDDLNNY